jgi:23S rRNA (cytosine1962-C5)-methyltransferase
MSTTYPAISLKPGREKSLRRVRPWVCAGGVGLVEGEPAAGSTVRVLSSSGEFLALAAYSPSSQIRARAWSFDDSRSIDATFIQQRVERAIGMRRQLGMLDEQGACRLIFSESDGLPGLIVDSYAAHLVCQFLSAGAEHWRDAIVDSLEQL